MTTCLPAHYNYKNITDFIALNAMWLKMLTFGQFLLSFNYVWYEVATKSHHNQTGLRAAIIFDIFLVLFYYCYLLQRYLPNWDLDKLKKSMIRIGMSSLCFLFTLIQTSLSTKYWYKDSNSASYKWWHFILMWFSVALWLLTVCSSVLYYRQVKRRIFTVNA